MVWKQCDAIYRTCDIPDFDCLLQLMMGSEASLEELEFVRKHEAWVIEFTEYDNTDLLQLETFCSNTNQFYSMFSQDR